MKEPLVPYPSLGAYLKTCRETANKTQAEVAKLLDVEPQFVSALERNRASIPLAKFKILEKAYPDFSRQVAEQLTIRSPAIITELSQFVRQFWDAAAGAPGTVYILSGKSLPFQSRKIAEMGSRFLQGRKNRVVFIGLDPYEDVVAFCNTHPNVEKRLLQDSWELTTLQDIRRVADLLSGGHPVLQERIQFFSLLSLASLVGGSKHVSLSLLIKSLPLFHPLGATMLFEPIETSEVADSRVGYWFIRSADQEVEEKQYAWVRLSDLHLRSLSPLVHALIKHGGSNGYLRDDSPYKKP